jgi:hypothetical protein
MREELAQRALAAVMGWQEERLLEEQDVLQTLATYKYDSYENFEPGVKFVESLAQWLYQFQPEHREIAYRFVRDRLVFISASEMTHLVRSIYPDVIRPVIRRASAEALRCSEYAIRHVEQSQEFRDMLRRSLFLGLSDGARIDAFRRSSPDLDNEQVHAAYDVADAKLDDMRQELTTALGPADGERPGQRTFRLLFLLDDFAGTGTTMLRRKRDRSWTGRLRRVSDHLKKHIGAGIFDARELEVYVCLYIATDQALDHLTRHIAELEDAPWARCEVRCVQRLAGSVAIRPGHSAELDAFLAHYYSKGLEDRESYRVGGKNICYGYGECGLPVIIHHNTPNNSLYVLWKAGNPQWPLTPLFRRFERHRKPAEEESDAAQQ